MFLAAFFIQRQLVEAVIRPQMLLKGSRASVKLKLAFITPLCYLLSSEQRFASLLRSCPWRLEALCEHFR